MQVGAVFMDMGMLPSHARMCGREFVADPFHRPGQIQHTKQNQHQANGKFHRQAEPRRDRQTKQDDGRADGDNGQGMTATPQDANYSRFGDRSFAADDRGHGNDVIRIGGMPHPEKKTDY
jgi:hypothetical protein